MSQETPQTYANHARIVPLFHYLTFGLLTVNFLGRTWLVIKTPSLATELDVALATGLLLLAWFTRVFPLTAQNRVIRLEERMRLERLLPDELRGRINELTVGQMVGLRFASDGELAELVRRILAGELKTNDQVKKAIKSWRADHVRV